MATQEGWQAPAALVSAAGQVLAALRSAAVRRALRFVLRLQFAAWLLLTGLLLVLGAKLRDLSVEWAETRRAQAQAQAARTRGFIGLTPARVGLPPPQPHVRLGDGHTWLRANPGKSRAGWYDVTDCLLPATAFSFEMGLFQAVDHPIHVKADHPIARRLMADDEVFGVVLEGQACAYPQLVMQRVALVNEELAGQPIAVTYFPPPLADVAAVYARDAVHPPPVLEVTGYLYANQPVFFDRESESLWYPTGGGEALTAVCGPRVGERLPRARQLERTTWGQWQSRHRQTAVLVGADRGTSTLLPLRRGSGTGGPGMPRSGRQWW